MISTDKSLRQQFADTMLSVGCEDNRLCVLIGDISHFIMQPFAMACPQRFYNVGICEPTIIGMGAGLAKSGLVPVMHTIAPFLIERSFEQIKLDFCYQKLGGNLITVGGAFDYANLGCTHHCYDDFALIGSLPGTSIMSPGSASEFDILFRSQYESGALNLFRLTENPHGVAITASDIAFGKGIKIADGSGLTIVAAGPQLRTALAARGPLATQGVSAEIIYIPTIDPLDLDLIRTSISKTRRVIVLEEHIELGGLGSRIIKGIHGMEGISFNWIGIPDRFIRSYQPYEDHCASIGLSVDGICKKAASISAR